MMSLEESKPLRKEVNAKLSFKMKLGMSSLLYYMTILAIMECMRVCLADMSIVKT